LDEKREKRGEKRGDYEWRKGGGDGGINERVWGSFWCFWCFWCLGEKQRK
jgi:hypothetical protein